MLPEISLFGLKVGTYSLMAFLAMAAFIAVSFRPLRRCSLSAAGIIALDAGICIAFLVGARLWNVAVNPGSYGASRPWYSLEMTGFSMYGGLAGALLVTLLTALISRTRFLQLPDALTVPGAIAFCIARVGCFLNGCCSGKETDLPWGVVFPPAAGTAADPLVRADRIAVHPTQLYELFLALVGIPLCLWIVKKACARTGGRFLLYSVWFSVMRLAVLPFRVLPYSLIVRNIVYPAIYYVLIVIGVFLFVWVCRRGRNAEEG